ncbi:MAG TPA: low molecular weight protein arginine phosphatase [Bacillota bacterium]|nr:low molecular weight protein arginine phosphatase [Bacillota bacterium]
MNILFVCTGNTCRSPMAEGMMRQLAALHGLEMEVKSAGVFAMVGAPASSHTDTILRNRGIDDFFHSSQTVTPELIEWSDLILTMTTSHKDILLSYFPAAIPKTFTIKEYVINEENGDVTDPFGGPLEAYQETEKELNEILNKMITKFLNS